MVTVPTLSPDVQTQAQPFAPGSAQATPQAFGSGVGAAVTGLGVSIDDDAKVAAKIGTDLAINQSIRTTKAADAGRIAQQTQLDYVNLPGGPDGNHGFYSLKGQAAIDAQPTYMKALADGEAETVKNFGDDQRAVDMYQRSAGIRMADTQRRAAIYTMQQSGVADIDSSNSRIQSYNDNLTANYNDPVALKNYQQTIGGEMATQGRINGWTPETLAEATKQRLSKGYSDAIRASAANGDIGTAANLFNQLSPGMDAQTRVSLAEHLKPKIMAGAATSWLNANLSPIGGAGPASSSDSAGGSAIAEAIHGQESGGRATSATSVDGARGGWQITQGTFDQYAKPGEKIDNPVDNETVGRRIIGDYNQRYNGDAGRVATAYFSGPGNVSPAGATVPYLKDTRDGNGKAVSSYVSDVMGRMGQGAVQNASYDPAAPGTPVGQAASSNNAARVADQTAVHPDFDGVYQKAAVTFANDPEMFQVVGSKIKQGEASYNMGVHTQREALTKSLTDTAASLADGQAVEIPEVAIRHVFDGPTADAMMTKLHQAQDFGQVYAGVQTMPAADLVAARQKLADGLGTKAAFPIAGAKGAIGPGAPSEDETPDFTNKYNTVLPAADEAKYQAWGKEQAAKNGGRNPAADTFDYDMRGFWKAGDGNPTFADNGHAGDAFKKPNHPTFSTLSNYNGQDGHQGGEWSGGQDGQPWNFKASDTNVKMQGADGLKHYFAEREQGNSVTLPPEQAAANPAAPEGYAQRQQELAHFDAAVAKRNKLLTDDPAGYAQALPAVASAFQSAGQDPAKMQAAIDLSRSTQRGLGVQDSDIRSLPEAQIGALVKTLHTASPDGKTGVDIGGQLDKMAQQYGPQWPGVFSDLVRYGKLDPSYQTLAVMDQPSQVGARENLQRALQLKDQQKADFGSSVPYDQKQSLEHGIDDHLADFQGSTRFGGSQLFDQVVKPSVKTLATYYAGQGVPGDDAAKRAVDEVINAKYDISGGIRAPKGTLGAVTDAGDYLKQNLTQADLAPNGATVAQARNGQWATLPDGSGVALMAKSTQGGFLPIRDAKGNYVQMKFNALPQAPAPQVSSFNPGTTE